MLTLGNERLTSEPYCPSYRGGPGLSANPIRFPCHRRLGDTQPTTRSSAGGFRIARRWSMVDGWGRHWCMAASTLRLVRRSHRVDRSRNDAPSSSRFEEPLGSETTIRKLRAMRMPGTSTTGASLSLKWTGISLQPFSAISTRSFRACPGTRRATQPSVCGTPRGTKGVVELRTVSLLIDYACRRSSEARAQGDEHRESPRPSLCSSLASFRACHPAASWRKQRSASTTGTTQ